VVVAQEDLEVEVVAAVKVADAAVKKAKVVDLVEANGQAVTVISNNLAG
jgi:hypothetical protein